MADKKEPDLEDRLRQLAAQARRQTGSDNSRVPIQQGQWKFSIMDQRQDKRKSASSSASKVWSLPGRGIESICEFFSDHGETIKDIAVSPFHLVAGVYEFLSEWRYLRHAIGVTLLCGTIVALYYASASKRYAALRETTQSAGSGNLNVNQSYNENQNDSHANISQNVQPNIVHKQVYIKVGMLAEKLYVKDENGERELTTTGGSFMSRTLSPACALSPDEKRVAYIFSPYLPEIFIINIDGSQKRSVLRLKENQLTSGGYNDQYNGLNSIIWENDSTIRFGKVKYGPKPREDGKVETINKDYLLDILPDNTGTNLRVGKEDSSVSKFLW